VRATDDQLFVTRRFPPVCHPPADLARNTSASGGQEPMESCRLDEPLRKRLKANPLAPVDLIIRVSGDLEAHVLELGRRGLAIYRRMPLIGAVAAHCRGAQALALSYEPWVHWIGEDREVRALVCPESHAERPARPREGW
jgi:hypothetical protein